MKASMEVGTVAGAPGAGARCARLPWLPPADRDKSAAPKRLPPRAARARRDAVPAPWAARDWQGRAGSGGGGCF